MKASVAGRFFLVFHGRFPSEKAAALFLAQEAAAFAREGKKVIVLVPRRKSVKEDPFAYYRLEQNFKVVYVRTFDFFALLPRAAAFYASFLAFSFSTLLYLLRHASADDMVYSNESLPLFLSTFFFRNTAYELHDFPERKFFFYRLLFRRLRFIISTNEWKARQLQKQFAVPAQKILVELNAVDTELFSPAISKAEARLQLGLPEKDVLILYTGHLYAWKGVETLMDAIRLLPEARLMVVGGTFEDQKEFKDKYGSIPNITLVGYEPHRRIPLWQRAADVAVLPNTATEMISQQYTSPMKLFEYLASGVPVVASDLPSIRAIVHEDMVVFAEPDSPQAFKEALQYVLSHAEEVQLKASAARAWVEGHSWQLRAQRILRFLYA